MSFPGRSISFLRRKTWTAFSSHRAPTPCPRPKCGTFLSYFFWNKIYYFPLILLISIFIVLLIINKYFFIVLLIIINKYFFMFMVPLIFINKYFYGPTTYFIYPRRDANFWNCEGATLKIVKKRNWKCFCDSGPIFLIWS